MTLLIVFRDGAKRTNEVIYARPDLIQPPDIAFPFEPVAGDRIAEHYTHAEGELIYSPPTAPPPAPDVTGFLRALAADPNVSEDAFLVAFRASLAAPQDVARTMEERLPALPERDKTRVVGAAEEYKVIPRAKG